jgi:hypothetical protein
MKPVAVVLLVAQFVATIAILPDSPLAHPTEPTYIAAVAALLTTVVLLVARFVARPPWFDRLVLAMFLAAMPFIYVWCALLRGDTVDLGVEAIGIVIYVAAAVAGYTRWPWLLGVGILLHGVGWDAWHHAHSGYVPDWYSLACLIADVGVGAFALAFVREIAPPMSQRAELPRLA